MDIDIIHEALNFSTGSAGFQLNCWNAIKKQTVSVNFRLEAL